MAQNRIRILIMCCLVSLLWLAPFSTRAAAGDLDPSFNLSGFTTTDLLGTKDQALALAIQKDGKLIAAGYSTGIGTAKDFSLVRYNPDGSRDLAFGIGGKVITQAVPGNQNDVINAIALQPDGNIVVAGAADVSGGNSDFVIARYISTTGTLDPSFGVGGIVITALSSKNDIASALAIQKDRHILVGGSSDGNFALARYNPNGSLDSSLHGVGFVTTDFGKNDLAHAMLLQPDDKIVLGGESDAGATGTDFALARYTSTGDPDVAFNGSGRVVTNFSLHSNEFINALALQANGKIIAVGRTNSNISDFALARYTSAGLLDATFGGGSGFTSTSIGPGDDEATAVLLQHRAEDILVAGFSYQGATRLNDFALLRYKNNGDLDPSFGSGGVVTTTLTATSDDLPFAMAAQADHKIVLAGSLDPGTNTDFAVARFLMPNTPPTAADFTAGGLEDTPLPLSAQMFITHTLDADFDPLVKVRLDSLPGHGVLALGAQPAALHQEIPAASLGSLSFIPDPDWNGTASFQWTPSDGLDFAALPASAKLTLLPVNDAPAFAKGPDLRLAPPAQAQAAAGWASGISPGPADEAAQALNFLVTNDNNALFSVQPSLTPEGSLSFTPAPGVFGAALVTVRLQDDGGTANGGLDTSAPQTFQITLLPYTVFMPAIQGAPAGPDALTNATASPNDPVKMLPPGGGERRNPRF